MASPADFVPHDADAAGGSSEYMTNSDLEEESFQGPHPWRQRLRPVPRRIAENDEEGEEHDSGRADNSTERNGSAHGSDQEERDGDTPRSHRSRDPLWKKDMMKKRRNRFMNRHTNANGSAASQIPVFSLLKRRPAAPSPESPFTLQVVNAVTYAPGPPRKRSSPSNSFRQSGPPSRRNTQTNIEPTINSEVTKKRVERVQRARLYLLQQTGPNSFLIGGDSPDHKFRVIIGQQTCSCGRGPHCVHVLFVMLRVFQVRENDPCLWSRTLKNYEVENLFRIYHDKRTSRLNNQRDSPNKSLKTDQEETENTSDGKEETSAASSDVESGSTREEEDTCPICLLEMLEGESLIRCENGCQNRLHHHCIAVWFEECRRQAEPLICPLCRANWKSNTVEMKINQSETTDPPEVPPNTRASSPQTVTETESRLPYAEPIPQEHQATAAPWIEVLGEDLVSCLFSRNWSVRESGLKHLGKELVATLLRGMGEGRSGVLLSPTRQATTHTMLETCCNVLAYMCADPVYRVFVASLRAIRTMLSYTPCRDEAQQERLQALLKPIVDAIIVKCTDGNKRTSQLSLSTLMEMAKGQSGELAVGKEIVDPGAQGLDGLNYVLRCATEDYSLTDVQWQWLLGRLYIIDRMIDEFPNELVPAAAGAETVAASPPSDAGAASAAAPGGGSPESTPAAPRLISIAKFCIQAVCSSHIRIARMSRRVFLLVAKLGAHLESIIRQLEELLETVQSSSMASLRRKVSRIVDDFHLSDRIVHELHHGTRQNLLHTMQVDSPIPTPDDTPISTPRCNSPVLEPGKEAGGSSPGAPPNTPVHRLRRRPRRTLSRKLAKEVENILVPPPSPEVVTCRSPPVGKSPSEKSSQGSEDSSTPLLASIEVGPTVYFHSASSETSRLPRANSVPANPSSNTPTVQCSDKSTDTSDSLWDTGVYSLQDCGSKEEVSLSDQEPRSGALRSPRQEFILCWSCGKKMSEEELSSCSEAGGTEKFRRQRYHTSEQESMSSDDFLDPHDSTSPSENAVSFKSEVASTPKTSPEHTADQARGEACGCKEEVEREEAEALVRALAVSERQDPCPIVPGLTPTHREEVITIRIQEDISKREGELEGENGDASRAPSVYLENLQWKKGPLLGTGAYSTCYQAKDLATGVIMAVKQISFCRNSPQEQEKVIETITEEVHMMARLNHTNVVRILGATKQGCHFNMFVEWMPGGSVSYLLGQYGAFSEQVIISYTQQILRGLMYLHDNQILHRDLKGANLLVDGSGKQLRIGDFGAAARLASQATGAGEFQGQLLGTIAFMAPEVLRGQNYGRACDVWSVGCCIIEMATTRPPWNAHDVSNHLALIFKIASSVDAPPVPENLNPAVRDLMLRCLEQTSADRPPAKELLMHPLFTQYWRK